MNNSTAEKLSRLSELHKAGRITLEEYILLKKRLLQESQAFINENISDSVNEYAEDNIIKNEKAEEADEFDETTDETLQTDESIAENSRTPKSRNVIIAIISVLIIGSCILYVLLFSNNSKETSSEVQNIIPNSDSKEPINSTFKYSELSTKIAKIEIENALMQIYKKDYYDINRTYPATCELSCNTIIIRDLNGDTLPDAFAHYWGEDSEVYGNASQMGWLVLLNTGNTLEILHPTVDYRFEFDKFSKDTLIGLIPIFDGATCCPTSKNEVKYLFRDNDFKLFSEKTVWEEFSNEANETDVIENDKSNIVNQTELETLERDPRAKDVANVFWDSKYTLYCLLTDEPINPDVNGEYDIWYSSNEDPYPNHKILTKQELPSLLFYKFKDYESCKKWCDAKKVK
jgi:hypothetical protein